MYAQAMRDGLWSPHMQTQPVSVYCGRLRDGNHRMRAVVASDVTVTVWVVGVWEEIP